MRFVSTYLRQISAGVRVLLVLTVALGIGYPVAITAIAQIPGLRDPANGSMLSRDGKPVGSSIIGQSFTKADGTPLTQYFQSRPSAGDYDPTASGASNLGPESVQDVLPDPKVKGDAGTPSLLTTVCARSLAIGKSDGVDGRRPYCTSDGVGAVLRVFYTTPGYRGAITRVVSVNQACPATPFVTSYGGKRVECARFGADYSAAKLILVRGDAPAESAVPADAITASGSGLDPDISPAYARIQVARVAQARRITAAAVETLVRRHTDGRLIGFVGEPTVNVLELNLDLDRRYPASR